MQLELQEKSHARPGGGGVGRPGAAHRLQLYQYAQGRRTGAVLSLLDSLSVSLQSSLVSAHACAQT